MACKNTLKRQLSEGNEETHMQTELCMCGRLKHGFHTRLKMLAAAPGGNQISGRAKKSTVHQRRKREVLSHTAGVWITFLIGPAHEHHCSRAMSRVSIPFALCFSQQTPDFRGDGTCSARRNARLVCGEVRRQGRLFSRCLRTLRDI